MGLLNSAAAMGRGGDTRLAHLTPGEVVIPKEVAALRPDLIAHIGQQIRQMGGNPGSLTVGQGRINPQTGIEEFATEAEVIKAYQDTLGRAPDDAGKAYWMGQGNLDAFKSVAAPEVASNVSKAYETNFGRAADTAGSDYWTQQVNSGAIGSVDALNKSIAAGAQGADITAKADGAKYATAWTPGTDANGSLTYDAAQDKWNPSAAVKPVVAPVQAPAPTPAYAPNLTQTVNQPTMTIEGRIQGLLSQNNPVIRQAGDRALAAFAQRGLLNSSMAQEAAMEAMTSKAIEIAGPDAATYFKQSNINQDATNQFAKDYTNHGYDMDTLTAQQKYGKEMAALNNTYTSANMSQQHINALQTNYLQAMSTINSNYDNQYKALQQTSMAPADKQSAMADLDYQRDTQIRLTSRAFSKMPDWVPAWGSTKDLPTSNAKVEAMNLAVPQALTDADLNEALDYGSTTYGAIDNATWTALINEAQRRKTVPA